jgi:hypothetical protein
VYLNLIGGGDNCCGMPLKTGRITTTKPAILMGGNSEGSDKHIMSTVDIDACIIIISFMIGPNKTPSPEYFPKTS